MQLFDTLLSKLQHPLFRNSVYGSGGFIIISLIGLLITPLIVVNFGFEQYGIYILVTSIVGYYGIFDFGLGQGLIKFVSEYNSQNKNNELNTAVNSVFFVQLFIGVILTGGIFLYSEEIIGLFNVSTAYYADSIIALKIASIGFLFSMLAATYSSAIKGLELFGRVTIVDVVTNLTLNIFLLSVILMNYGIKEAVLINVFISLIQMIAYMSLFKRIKKEYRFRFNFNVPLIKNFISFSIFLFLSRISNTFAVYVVRYVISYFLGPIAVTFYIVPSKILGVLGGVLSSAANAIFPYTSRLAAMGHKDEIQRSFIKSNLLFASVSLPISIFIILFSKPIMTLWMGEYFAEKSWMILSIITLSSTIGSFSAIPNLVLLGLGNSKLIGLFSGITIISYIIFLPLLTKYFGLIGASSALLATSLIVIGFVLVKTTKAIGVKLLEYFNEVYKSHIIPIILFAITAALYKMFPVENYLIELAFGMTLSLLYYVYLYKRRLLIF